ncbi:metallophosphoesterase [Brucellaceae bacterium C25G]
MKCNLTVALSAALLASLSLVNIQATEASAAVRKDVSEFAGERCNTPPKGSGAVVGIFNGYEDRVLSYDSKVTINRYRCFKTLDECQGWLYTMNSKYLATNIGITARCFVR